MKILWCHEVSYLDKPVYEYQDLAERLAARGHTVEVIDFNESKDCAAGSKLVSRTGQGEVLHTSIPHGNTPGFKYVQGRRNFRSMLLERLENSSIDVIFVYSIFINGTQAVDIAKRHGIPVIYRVLDAYHQLRPRWMERAILKAGEKFIYRRADKVLVTNERMLSYATCMAGDEDDPRYEVLDHGVDTCHFRPLPRDQELSQELGIGSADQVLLFLGTTYSFSGLVNLVKRMPTLLSTRPNLKLLVLGAGEQDNELRQLVRDMTLEASVILPGMIEYSDLPRYLSTATVALNPFEINEITKDIVPIKILQYQACGIPVVSTPLPDLMLKHPEKISGITYSESDDIVSFISALESILDSEIATEQGRRGLAFVSQRYSVERTVEKLEEHLSLLLSRKR